MIGFVLGRNVLMRELYVPDTCDRQVADDKYPWINPKETQHSDVATATLVQLPSRLSIVNNSEGVLFPSYHAMWSAGRCLASGMCCNELGATQAGDAPRTD
jgi:hypothetical protein